MKKIYLIGALLTLSIIALSFIFFQRHISCQYSNNEINSLKKSAANGDYNAAWELYGCYQEDDKESLHWLKIGATAGDLRAKFNLYSIFMKQNDIDAAVFNLLDAANHGYTPAQLELGGLYLKGSLWESNPQHASFWFRAAAISGDEFAMFELAKTLIYIDKPRNINESCDWSNKAMKKAITGSALYAEIGAFLKDNCH